MVLGLSASSSSSFPSSTSMTLSKQEIDHPTSSSSSSTSPPMTSSTVSSESVARQERRDLCGICSWFSNRFLPLPVRLHQHLQHPHRRILKVLYRVQHLNEVTVKVSEYGETRCLNNRNSKTPKKKDS